MSSTECHKCRRAIGADETAWLIDGQATCLKCHHYIRKICPSCGVEMKRKLPKRYGDCHGCGDRFYIDRDQSVFPSALISADQVERLSTLGRARVEINELGMSEKARMLQSRIEKGPSFTSDQIIHSFCKLAVAGITKDKALVDSLGAQGCEAVMAAVEAIDAYVDEDFWQAYPTARVATATAELTTQFSMTPSASDIRWRVLQEAKDEADRDCRQNLYLVMQQVLSDEGKNTFHVKREFMRLRLQGYSESEFVTGVEVLLSSNPCPECQEMAGRTYSIEEALKDPPVPCKTCTTGLKSGRGLGECRCDLRAVRGDV